MKNVKVILLSVVLCAAVFANSRIDALGGDAGFWAGDRDNIYDFPATINDHDFVEIDNVGATDGVDATILWGDATTWGFNFTGDDEDTWFNLLWGNGDVGLNVGYIASDCNDGDCTTDGESSGFRLGYGQNFDWGELGVGFNSVDDWSSYWANWRADLDAWVFTNAKAGLRAWDNGLSGADAESSMVLDFDMYTHLDAGGADVLFGLGIEYATATAGSGSDAVDMTWMTLPTATLAVEAALTDWATLRAHVTHRYQFSCADDGLGLCTDDAAGPSYEDYNSFDDDFEDGEGNAFNADNTTTYGFGLGFNWGQATLDMEIGESLFTDPVTMMNGRDDDDPLARGEVTLSYSF